MANPQRVSTSSQHHLESSEAGRASLSPEQLMERINCSDDSALADLYDRYVTTLLGLAKQIVGSREDAEEVVQEVFVQIWNRAGQYDPSRATVSTWLLLLTRRKAIDRLRRERTGQRAHAELCQQPHSSAVAPQGGRRVIALEERRRMAQALASLPPEQCQVLVLAYYRGLTQRQIAAELSIPLGTVKTRSVLGMKKLRRSLQGELGSTLAH